MRAANRTMESAKNRAEMRPLTLNPREGWEKDSQRVAKNKGDALVWPEFGNADDVQLRFDLTHTAP